MSHEKLSFIEQARKSERGGEMKKERKRAGVAAAAQRVWRGAEARAPPRGTILRSDLCIG